ncbi:unnamed protein product [Closterium sp. Yama58-4]|nr:unnamed protein product [Closterium sp. Yama58-4]
MAKQAVLALCLAALVLAASAGDPFSAANNKPVNVAQEQASDPTGAVSDVSPAIVKQATTGDAAGITVVSTATDSMLFADAKSAGWNKMKCHAELKPHAGACTPSNCSKGGIPAKWKTSNLLKNKIGIEVYVKGNPLTLKKASPQTCCNTCASSKGCTYWQYIPDITLDGKKTDGACYLVKDEIDYTCGELIAQYATETKPIHLQCGLVGWADNWWAEFSLVHSYRRL